LSDAPQIRSILDLSTAHLPEEFGQTLHELDGVIADLKGEYGYLMWVPPDPERWAWESVDGPAPAEILTVQVYARRFGCDYVLFDRDGPVNPDLPVWDW